MSFREYLQSHYVAAREIQWGFEHDRKMIAMLRNGLPEPSLVKSWMEGYGRFQGITTPQRIAIVECFLNFANSQVKTPRISDEEIKALYASLLQSLYREVARSWMSATSKLLWCLYPYDIVIYDQFVHRTLVVMQCIGDDLSGFPRIRVKPPIKSKDYISRASEHYMNYQAMVRKLLLVHAHELDELRRRYDESHPDKPYVYDIRIMDKILWMIGDPQNTY